MSPEPSQTPAEVWNAFFAEPGSAAQNSAGWWAADLLPFLSAHAARTVLDLGCGTGGDCMLLARHGLRVTGMDFAEVALASARARASAAGVAVDFCRGDMTQPLRFPDAAFDAVMSNLALHAFTAVVTRRIVSEIERIVRPGGLLLLHVSSLEDLPCRARFYRRVREIEPNFYVEATGKTIRFFSAADLRHLLERWSIIDLTHIALRDDAGMIYRCVWRCVAQKPQCYSRR